MKKFLRFLKAIPYFCLILSIICCSLMMAIPVSAASPLVGGGSGDTPFYAFDSLPNVHLPDSVASFLDSCVLVYTNVGTSLFIPDPGTSLSVSLNGDSYTVSGTGLRCWPSGSSWSDPVDFINYRVGSISVSIVYVGTNVSFSGFDSSNLVVSDISYFSSPTGVLDVAGGVGSWFMGSLVNAMEMFYADGALTFLGYLAVAGLAFSVFFLIIGFVSRFLKFGG